MTYTVYDVDTFHALAERVDGLGEAFAVGDSSPGGVDFCVVDNTGRIVPRSEIDSPVLIIRPSDARILHL